MAGARERRRVRHVLDDVDTEHEVVALPRRDLLERPRSEVAARRHLGVDVEVQQPRVGAGDRGAVVQEPPEQGAGAEADLEDARAGRHEAAQPPVGDGQPPAVQSRVAAVRRRARAGRCARQVTVHRAAVRAPVDAAAPVEPPRLGGGAAHRAAHRHDRPARIARSAPIR